MPHVISLNSSFALSLAQEWFEYMEASDLLFTWSTFAHDLLQRFNPTIYDVPEGRLSKLLETSTVEEFQNRFEAQANKVLGIPGWLLKEMLLTRLKPEIQNVVLRSKPDFIQMAFSNAKLVERQ